MDLNYIKENHTKESIKFVMQTIYDLWENYMYDVRDAQDDEIDAVDELDVKEFQDWADKSNWYVIKEFLPEPPKDLAKIIKYCENSDEIIDQKGLI